MTPRLPRGYFWTGSPAARTYPRSKACWLTRIPGYSTFPGEVFLTVAADALQWCAASRTGPGPVPLDGIGERFLAEFSFRGRERRKLQYAILAAAALRPGTEPDLLNEVSWWQADDFWRYALYAAIAYTRLAASRAGVPVSQVCRKLAGNVHAGSP